MATTTTPDLFALLARAVVAQAHEPFPEPVAAARAFRVAEFPVVWNPGPDPAPLAEPPEWLRSTLFGPVPPGFLILAPERHDAFAVVTVDGFQILRAGTERQRDAAYSRIVRAARKVLPAHVRVLVGFRCLPGPALSLPLGIPWNLSDVEGVARMRELIGGGYLEAVRDTCGHGLIGFADEDGLRRKLQVNLTATEVFGKALVGPVIGFPWNAFQEWDVRHELDEEDDPAEW